MNNRLLILLSISLAASFAAAREIVVNPGELPEKILLLKGTSDNQLTIKGSVTSPDLTYLRLLPDNITALDLSQLNVKRCRATDGGWFGREHFEDGEIPSYMLMGTNVSSLKLPSNISSIGAGAFSATPLRELTIPAVKSIGEGAFNGCEQLKNVTISGANLDELPEYLFAGCRELENVNLPHSVIKVGKHAFEKTAVKSIFFPNAVELGDYAFAFADSLTEIYFANGCRMGEGVFYGTPSLEHIPASPANIPPLYSASGKYKDIMTIKDKEVGDGAFSGSSISIFGLSPNVKKIGRYSFSTMPNLESVDVSGCELITDVDPTAFAGNDVSKITLYVPKGTIETWRQAPVWGEFNISDEESVVEEVVGENLNIDILYSDGVISVGSALPIEEFALYGIDGKLLYSANPGMESVGVAFPDGEDIVIARAVGKGGVKIKKIMR